MANVLTPQKKVLAVAASQIGYSRWTDPKQGTKYARETQPVFWPKDTWLLANGISFCDIGITWTFWKALGKSFVLDGLPGGASYNTDYRASKGSRISKSKAEPGDILVFDWNWATASTNHVGLLEKRTKSGAPQTIEFNTSSGTSGSQSNGGGVYRRTRRWDQVRYVLRPDWSKAGGTTSSTVTVDPWEASATIQGLSTAAVKTIQSQLKTLGYDLGSYGVDGSYGKATYSAVRAFQKAQGLTVDGVAGTKTQAALTAAVKPSSSTSTVRESAPTFPLPKGYYYGPRSGPKQSVSGHVKNTATTDVVLYKGAWHSKGLRQWQLEMLERGWKGIGTADGLYGDKTARVARQFQKSKGLTVDGKIGSKTWKAAWEEPVE